jgi:hypothetical protein
LPSARSAHALKSSPTPGSYFVKKTKQKTSKIARQYFCHHPRFSAMHIREE